MTTSSAFDPDETIIAGLTKFGQATGDISDVQAGGIVYKSVAEVFRQNLKPGETCDIALAAMIIRPEIRTQCFVAITSSHLIVAWKKGVIRKTTESEVIPLSSITDAKWAVSTKAPTRGATLMHVEAGRSVTFALPKSRNDVASLVRDAILADHTS